MVERRNQTIVAVAQSLLKAKGVHPRFWDEAMAAALYLLKRATRKIVSSITPYEAWSGSRPSVHHFRSFGCVAHVKVTRPNTKMLDDRSVPMVLIGYEPSSTANHLFHLHSGRVHVFRDVVFDENALWD